MDQSDHDLLIVIANDMRWVRDWAIQHEKSDVSNYTEIKNIAKAAHNRMDKLMYGGILAVICLAITIWFK